MSSWAHSLTVGPNAQNNCHNLFFDLKESGTAPIHTVSLHENLSRCHWSESPKKDLMVIWSAGSRSEASSLLNTNMLSRSVDQAPKCVCCEFFLSILPSRKPIPTASFLPGIPTPRLIVSHPTPNPSLSDNQSELSKDQIRPHPFPLTTQPWLPIAPQIEPNLLTWHSRPYVIWPHQASPMEEENLFLL